jgi:hypothetical protein
MKAICDKKGLCIGVKRNARELEIIKHLKKGVAVKTPDGRGVITACVQKPRTFAGIWEVRLDKAVRKFNCFVGAKTPDDTLYFGEDHLRLA